MNYQLCMHWRANLIDAQSLLAYLLAQLAMKKSHRLKEYAIEFSFASTFYLASYLLAFRANLKNKNDTGRSEVNNNVINHIVRI